MTKILQMGEEALRKVAEEVPVADIESSEIQGVISNMREALKEQEDGVALAAPQIGISKRIFVVSKRIFIKDENAEDQVYINPKIVNSSQAKEWLDEGCLSVRWKYGKVERSKKVTIEAHNEKGEKIERGASNLLAQVYQHEIDHLEGILFIDKAKEIEEIDPEDLIKEV